MPWSIFSDGGGPGAALTWAVDLLQRIGAPLTPGNEQFVYDWQVSEGGGGKYNPLNQGPVPGHPELTSTGPQFGGGAADFVSWDAGIQGAADYLAMPSFSGIADALRAGDPVTARADLIASPWAQSHYGGGIAFSDSAPPGKASALPGGGGAGWYVDQATGKFSKGSAAPGAGWVYIPGSTTAMSQQQATQTLVNDIASGAFGSSVGNGLRAAAGAIPGVDQAASAISGLSGDLKTIAVTGPLILAGGALIVWGLARATGARQKAQNAAGKAAKIGALAA
jgi:hypothetical protein